MSLDGEISCHGIPAILIVGIGNLQFPWDNPRLYPLKLHGDLSVPTDITAHFSCGIHFLRRYKDTVIVQIQIKMQCDIAVITIVLLALPITGHTIENCPFIFPIRRPIHTLHRRCLLLVVNTRLNHIKLCPEFRISTDIPHRVQIIPIILQGFLQERIHLGIVPDIFLIDRPVLLSVRFLNINTVVLYHYRITCPQIIKKCLFLLLCDIIGIIFSIPV